ncbi:hypothetical protein BU17DRAFT_99266 [Hysterangium stoloniferum]|nr:hypothetical protein BU17DRAFT_99266 [Hysterangium stoloniferum]
MLPQKLYSLWVIKDEGKDAGMKTRSYSDTAHKRVTWAHLLSNTDLDDNALQDTPKDAAVDDYRPEVDASDSVDSEDIVMVSADSEKDDDNSTIEEGQKLKRRAKTKGRPPKAAAKAQPILSDNDRTIFVPLGFSNGQGRLTIPFGATFSEALHNIYEFMGCHNFTRKPDLHWEGLKQHARLVHTKDAIINGKLLVDESQGYMASLRKRLADTTTGALNAHSKKWRSKTVVLPMLNLDTTAGLQLDESELMSIKEKEKMQILKNRLKQCTKCGEEVYCKVNKHAVHVPLTLGCKFMHGHAHDTHGVMLDIPPDTGAFEDFHATRAERLAKTASVPTLATGPCPMDMTNATAPFAAMMMGMASGIASMMHAPPVAQAPTVLSTATVANSSNSCQL